MDAMNPESTHHKHRIREAAVSQGEAIAELLGELIRIPSPSGAESEVAGRIRQEMHAAGFDEVRVDALGSVIGRIGSGPTVIAMDAHIDTVGIGNREPWSAAPYSGEVRQGNVWGRGAADQKGGMAALIHAGRIVKQLGLDRTNRFTLYVTGTVMEEDCDGLCWQHLIREDGLRPEVVVVTEPTGCRVYRGQRGRMEIEIEVRGVSAHGSAPERGQNAIYRMTEVVRGVQALAGGFPSDEFLGPGSVTVTYIEGRGPSLCAVPDICRVRLDRRLTWGETPESALTEVQRVLDACAWAGEPGAARLTVPRYEKPAYTGKVYPGEAIFPAWKVASDHRAVRAADKTLWELFPETVARGFARVAGEASDSGVEPMPARWTFSTNGVAICGTHGIPCVGFGPGHEAQAHAPDEFCPIEELVTATAFYAAYPLVYDATREA
jgi:putative selenium metabolism hydrolase